MLLKIELAATGETIESNTGVSVSLDISILTRISPPIWPSTGKLKPQSPGSTCSGTLPPAVDPAASGGFWTLP